MTSEHAVQQDKRTIWIVVVAVAIFAAALVVVVLASKFIMMFTGTYDIDTVGFTLTDPATATDGSEFSREPEVWIDTHIGISLWSKTVTSSKPYSIGFDKTDGTFTFASATLTVVRITYDDGSVETSGPSLPLVFQADEYEATNSMAGGQVVTTKMRGISGRLEGVITRDESFTLDIEGYFTLDDGSTIPFTIKQHYDVEFEKSTRPVSEVMQA